MIIFDKKYDNNYLNTEAFFIFFDKKYLNRYNKSIYLYQSKKVW